MSMTSIASTQDVLNTLNTQELIARCMGNQDFAARVLATFQRRFGEDLAELDQALAAQDAEALVRLAHRMKGAAANVGAGLLRQAAAELEECGRTGRSGDAPPVLKRLRQEWVRFVDEVSSLDLHTCFG